MNDRQAHQILIKNNDELSTRWNHKPIFKHTHSLLLYSLLLQQN